MSHQVDCIYSIGQDQGQLSNFRLLPFTKEGAKMLTLVVKLFEVHCTICDNHDINSANYANRAIDNNVYSTGPY